LSDWLAHCQKMTPLSDGLGMSMPATMTRLVGTNADRRNGSGTASPVSAAKYSCASAGEGGERERPGERVRTRVDGRVDDCERARACRVSEAVPRRETHAQRRGKDARCFAFQTPASSSWPHALRPAPVPSWYSRRRRCALARSVDEARRVKGEVMDAKWRRRPTAKGRLRGVSAGVEPGGERRRRRGGRTVGLGVVAGLGCEQSTRSAPSCAAQASLPVARSSRWSPSPVRG